MDFFHYNDYLDILKAKIKENMGIRGYLGKIAKAAGFSSSYLSQVLGGSYHLNIEHAAALCDFWQADESSAGYFIALVQATRANHRSLKRLFRSNAEKLRLEVRASGKPFQNPDLPQRFLLPDDAMDYLGSLKFQAVYALVRVHRLPEPIAERLGLDLGETLVILRRLETWGLITFQNDYWHIKSQPIAFPSPPFVSRVQHLELRYRANQYMNSATSLGSHFTKITTVARKDLEVLKKMLDDLIDNQLKIIDQSPDEELVAFCYDFYVV